MEITVRGVYRQGKIELSELPDDVREGAPVIVTFVEPDQRAGIDLRSLGIDAAAAARMRMTLGSFADNWNSPEMDIYDDYDAAKAALG